jgi:hypothetical protein
LRAQPNRANDLRRIFSTDLPMADKLRLAWPRLKLVSCWTDAMAGMLLPELRRLMPHVEFQPKGLLSTEAFVSLPLCGQPGAALAIRSHFFEFEPLPSSSSASNETPDCRLAHQLERGQRYRVLVTTAGGLYRYQLYDEVMVTGFINECPLLRFMGRSEMVCDLVGEKLSEVHLRRVLDNIFVELQLTPSFAMLVPVVDKRLGYRLYLQLAGGERQRVDTQQLAKSLQRGLEENPHYRLASQLGQLSPVGIRLLDSSRLSGWQVFERQCVARGQKPGNIKPRLLDPWTGWADVFTAAASRASRPSG